MEKYQLLEIMKNAVTDNPDKPITRDFYRVATKIPDSEWVAHWGTFKEYRRAAGLEPSRQENKIHLDIATHASRDKLRELNVEKAAWAGNYIRPCNKRFQVVLVGSDMHDIDCDPFWLRTFLDTARRAMPEIIVLNGDLFDLPEFSRFTNDPRLYKMESRVKFVHKFLEKLRNICPDATIYFVGGNHEHRIIKYLSFNAIHVIPFLADIHGMTIPKMFGLEKFQINYVDHSDLTAFSIRDINDELKNNYIVLHDMLLFHHFPEGEKMGMPGAHGHHHKHWVRNHYSPKFGSYEWHQTGGGCVRKASYCSGEKWSEGFLLCNMDIQAKRTQFEYIDVTNQHAVIAGQWYSRTPEEMVFWR
jgi:hypothetical protein